MSDDLNHKNGHTNRDEIDEFLSQFDSEGPSLTPDEQKISELEKITDDLSKTLNKTRIFKSEDIEAAVTGRKQTDVAEHDPFLEELPTAKPSRVERLGGGRSARRSSAEKNDPESLVEEAAASPVSAPANLDDGQAGRPEELDPLWSEQIEMPRLPKLNIGRSKKKQGAGKASEEGQQEDTMAAKGKKGKKKKKHRFSVKRLLVSLILLGVIVCMVGGIGVAAIIISAEPIHPDKLYDNLPENSTIYAKDGRKLETLQSDGMRTNIDFDEMPNHLVEAFISIEDKTFWDHSGFNFIRIFGAIWEKVKGGGRISGTSTITQQLARNVYLTDTKGDYDMSRKIVEAYYAFELERKLNKQQIITAYLNTIFLGNEANGVQAAARNYFNKDVWDLNLAESAVLASLAQLPFYYAPMKKDTPERLEELDDDLIIYEDPYYIYYYNDTYRNRQLMVLSQMLEQGKITQQEHDEAVAYDIKGALRADQFMTTSLSSYFVDYARSQVIEDLMEQFDIDEDEAKFRLYSRGYHIYTTLDMDMQEMVETLFSDTSNFPGATALNLDSERNIRSKNNQVLLYSAVNYFASFTGEEEKFLLNPDEYTFMSNGDLVLYANKRLNFKANNDIEFKNLYYYDANNVLTTMDGGVISVGADYKRKDDNGNMVISASYLSQHPEIFAREGDSLVVPKSSYTLRTAVMQPQAAMVIIDHQTSEINAMVGGRSLGGRLLFNRATKPRQPGSSIKPIAVYAAALEASGIDGHTNGDGRYWTAATGVEDSPVNGSWPKNWYSGYKGRQSIRTAIQQSTNTVAVKVFNDIGYQYSVDMLERLGVTTIEKNSSQANDLNPAALALGGMTYGISPLEMAGAYTAFPNGGVYKEPIAYTKIVTRNGDVIIDKVPKETQAMDEGVAWIMTDLLRSTVTSGLASRAQNGVTGQVAGKTGTTSDNFDAWFVGFTPQYSAAVWIGNDVNIELTRGSAAAMEVWNKVMRNVPSNKTSLESPMPSNVTVASVDAVSGLLPTGFSSVRSEYFIIGTTPSAGDYDTYNTSRLVCGTTGMLPTPLCPEEGLERKYHYDAENDTYWTPPTTYCWVHNDDHELYPITNDDGEGPAGLDDEEDDNDPSDSDGSTGSTGNNGSDSSSNNGSTDGSGSGTGDIPIVDTEDNTPEPEENAGSTVPDWLNIT